jgi:bifunctional non-homologous end joining protein LigD
VDASFIPATRRKVHDRSKKLVIPDCPFVTLPGKRGRHRMDREKMNTVTWVKPKVVVEIAMNEWTPDHHLRHAEFKRLREDMKVKQVSAYPANEC